MGKISGFRKRGRRNGVAFPIFSVFFRFLPFSSVFFRFFFPFSSVFFRFLPFSSVSFRFFPFFFVSFSEKERGDTVRETPFAKRRRLHTAGVENWGSPISVPMALRAELASVNDANSTGHAQVDRNHTFVRRGFAQQNFLPSLLTTCTASSSKEENA